MPLPDRADYLVVATVRRPHGVRGELLVAVETDRPRAVFQPGRALWIGDAEGRPLGVQVTIERVRPMQDGILLKLAEYGGRSPEVEGLRGRSLLILATDAAPAAPEEVHYRDLVGMEVVRGEEELGTVQAVMDTPAGELLVIRRPTGRELLLPFVKAVVHKVDRTSRRIEVDPPEGLLDL